MNKLKITFLLLLFLLVGSFIWWKSGKKAVNPDSKEEKIFVIQKGESIRNIANKLKKEGLIKDPVVFFLYVKKEKLDKNIQAGDYRLSPGMNLVDIVSNLNHGKIDIWITVPEGLRAEEIGEILKKNFKNYDPSWTKALVQNNGYLFPDTYLVPKDADIDFIVSIMKDNFYKKLKEVGIDKDAAGLKNIVIIASMIEREAKYEEDRPFVASVIFNRIDQDMPLQIDATIQYALSYQVDEQSWWKQDLTSDDLKVNSLFNTYQATGLPPAPISNPGLLSMKAAASPPKTDYLYYVSDKKNYLHFAKTLVGHNKNIEKYLGYDMSP